MNRTIPTVAVNCGQVHFDCGYVGSVCLDSFIPNRIARNLVTPSFHTTLQA